MGTKKKGQLSTNVKKGGDDGGRPLQEQAELAVCGSKEPRVGWDECAEGGTKGGILVQIEEREKATHDMGPCSELSLSRRGGVDRKEKT